MSFDYNSPRWKRLRKIVLRRDGYQCQRCKKYGKQIEGTIVHHIKEADEYPELSWNIDNMETVCMACHNKLHPEKGKAGIRGRMNR